MTPQEYFDRIKNCYNPDTIKFVVEELIKNLVNETDKPRTRLNKLAPYNKLINTIPHKQLLEGQNAYIQTRADGSYWKRHLHFKFTGIADINFNGKDGINTKSKVLGRLGNKQLLPIDEYLEATTKLLQSNDAHELAVGLIAASGRRLIEIVARGSFTLETELPTYLKPGYFVRFSGQAKNVDKESLEYRIGVLVPASSFVQAFEKFRVLPESIEIATFLKNHEGTPEQANAMIEDRRGNSLRRVAAREFKGIKARNGDLDLNPKALRAMYVAAITERDCPKNINDLLWKAQSLGHFIDSSNASDRDLISLLTTLGYSDFYTDKEVPFIPEITITPIETKETEEDMTTTIIETTAQTTEDTTMRKERKSVSVDSEAFTRIKELQTEWELPNQQAVINKLLELLDKKVEEKTELKTQKPERNLQDIESEALKKLRGEDAVNEKIRRAFEAITSYNDNQPSNDARWYIGNQTLRQVSGCNGLAISAWIKNHQISVDDHNNKYNLGQYHNNLHRGKDLTELLS
jgi:hypothetical protein